MKKNNVWRKLSAVVTALALVAVICEPALSARAANSAEPVGELHVVTAPPSSSGGAIPEALDQSYYNYQGDAPRTFGVLPASYDLRTQGKTTTVKNQSPWGTCWTFGAMASAESNVLKNSAASANAELADPDYSERHIAWFAYQQQNGEGKQTSASGNSRLDLGGNRGMVTGLLSSWAGVQSETNVPYLQTKQQDWSVDEGLLYGSVARVQNVDYLPGTARFSDSSNHTGYSLDEAALATIKQAVMENGAVNISYYADQSRPDQSSVNGKYINNNTYAQYTYEYMQINHTVAIVGWDDSYDKSNFIEGHQPPENGAWIVKNSWGDGWGNNGYFYLSYYDQSVTDFTNFHIELPQSDGSYAYDHNYQYDFLGQRASSSFTPWQSPTTAANVFTAGGKETLKAVSAITAAPDSTVEISVYRLNANYANPTDGTLVSQQTTSVPFGGYHTIPLETPVELEQGDKFSVVETIQGSNGYVIPVEVAGSFGATEDVAVCAVGESFMRFNNGAWLDLKADATSGANPLRNNTVGNAMIKAFTVDTPAEFTQIKLELLDIEKQRLMSATLNPPFLLESLAISGSAAFVKVTAAGTMSAVQILGKDGQTFTQNDYIPRAMFETGLTIADASDSSVSVSLSFNPSPSTLSDASGVVLADFAGYIPKNAGLSVTTQAPALVVENIKGALEALGDDSRDDSIRLYQPALSFQSQAYTLKGPVRVSLPCLTGQAAKTNVYRASQDGSTLTLVADLKTEGDTVVFETDDVNALFVCALSNTQPPLPVLSGITYSPAKTLADVIFPTAAGGSWSWDDPTTIPTVDAASYPATFTPSAGSKFEEYKVNVTLSVSRANLTVQNQSAGGLVYGQPLSQSAPTAAVTCDGVDVPCTLAWKTPDAVLPAGAQQAAFSVIPNDTVNYNSVDSVLLKLDVSPKPVTVTADDASTVYGAAKSNFTYSFQQGDLVGNDTQTDLGVLLSCAATVVSPVGTYPITGLSTSLNYEVTVTPGTLSITKRPIAITIQDVTLTALDPIPTTFDFDAVDLVNGDAKTVISTNFTTTAKQGDPFGDYPITGTASADNYEATVTPGTLTIAAAYSSGKGNVDNQSGYADSFALSGSVTEPAGAKLVIEALDRQNQTVQQMISSLSSMEKDKAIFKASLTGGASITGQTALMFPVPSQYNGKTVSVLHFVQVGQRDKDGNVAQNSTVERFNNVPVKDGKATVVVGSLNEFLVAAEAIAPPIPQLSAISYDPGKTLADVALPTIDGGTWEWVNPDTVPTVNTNTYLATFTADLGSDYTDLTTAISLTVNKAKPVVGSAEAQTDLTYGQPLSAASLQYSVTLNGVDVPGTAAWANPDTTPKAGENQTFAIVFTPTDTDNYETVQATAKVHVKRAPISLAANDQEMAYGDAAPSLTYTFDESQLVNGDTADALKVNLTTTAASTSPVGTYAITGTVAADNYDVTVTPGTMTVKKRAISMAADSKEMAYGNPLPGFTYTVNGLVNGDSPDVITASLSANATSASPAGIYAITGTATADNYAVTVTPGTLTVKKRAVTIAANDQEMTYGDKVPVLTYTFDESQLVNGDTTDALTVNLTTTAASASPVGTYAVTGTVTADNYAVTVTPGTLTVKKRAVTIAANDQEMAYGDAVPNLTYTLGESQLVNGDTADALTVKLTTAATSASPVGTYAVTGTATADNYAVTVAPGTLTVKKRAITIAADNKEMAYGNPVPELTYTINGLVNGDSPQVITANLSTEATSDSPVGTYAITGTATADNYDVTVTPGTLTVKEYALTIVVDSKEMAYGDTAPNLTYTLDESQLVNGDTPDALTVKLTTTANSASPVGTYAITGTATADNYAVTVTPGTLTVKKRAVTIAADNKEMAYGDAAPNLTYTLDEGQLVNGDTADALTVNLTTTANSASPVGTYAVTGTATADNYDVTVTPGTLTVQKRAITIAADDKRVIRGQALPAFTFTVPDGSLINGDTADVLTVTLTTEATSASPVGMYAITGTATADNYTVSVTPATLAIYMVFSSENGNLENESNLPDEEAGKFELSGLIDADDACKLVIRDLSKDSAAALAFQNSLASGFVIINQFEVFFTGNPKLSGPLSLTFPVDEKYNGTNIQIMHYVEQGKLDQAGNAAAQTMVDRYDAVPVIDGKATIIAYSLSPFALAAPTEEPSSSSSEPGSSSEPSSSSESGSTSATESSSPSSKPGDSATEPPAKTGDSSADMAIAALAMAAAGAAFLTIRRRGAKRHRSTK